MQSRYIEQEITLKRFLKELNNYKELLPKDRKKLIR